MIAEINGQWLSETTWIENHGTVLAIYQRLKSGDRTQAVYLNEETLTKLKEAIA